MALDLPATASEGVEVDGLDEMGDEAKALARPIFSFARSQSMRLKSPRSAEQEAAKLTRELRSHP